ncbi:MAG: FtsX-like permease family protein [Ktedonobacteraceae bacterium]|nr:FtsX-like permease family protein [Ktedonobacteraceae bacterium]
MRQLFGIPLETLAHVLLVITLIIVGVVVVLALINRIFFKIGVRNIPRRRVQMVLIVFALMLSTTLLSSALETGNVVDSAVRNVAVYNLGNVDEIIQHRRGRLYDDSVYQQVVQLQKRDPNIAAVAAALVENDLLVADMTSRQVRSGVTGMGIIPNSELGFGELRDDVSKAPLRIARLKINEVYLNHTSAQLLNAHAGDTLYLYAKRWPGKRYEMHVKAIVADGGLVAQRPYLLTHVDTFRKIEQRRDDISHIYIANSGGGGLNGVNLSNRVSISLHKILPPDLRVAQVKADGVAVSQKAEDVFGRIFTLFCLFALAIGLLLIFLIFVLLAAERRAEMGMMRAIGVQRGHLVLMFLFEGAIYDLFASFIGLAAGTAVGALLILILGPILQRFNFPLNLSLDPPSLIIAYCLGAIFTFCSVVISSWLVSRMTIVDALRNLPESGRATLALGEALVRWLILSGVVPLLVGAWLFQYGLWWVEIIPFSLGLSLLVVGGGLLLKTVINWLLLRAGRDKRKLLNRVLAAVVGLSLMAYWALPFDVLANLGVSRFRGGIEVFFIAGVVMVLGAVWALVANAELVVNPLLSLCAWLSRLRPLAGLNVMARLAAAYPLLYRFRSGLGVIMFSLVIFAMAVMAVITSSMQNNYANFDVQTGGYDIQAVAYFKSIPDMRSELARRGIDPHAFSAIGVSTTTVTGVIQLGAATPAWRLYPARVVDGGFLQGYGLRLVSRASGFASDSAVWQALRTHPDYALIDVNALPYLPGYSPAVYDPSAPRPEDAGQITHPPGLTPYYSFSLSGLYQGENNFSPPSIWVSRSDLAQAMKLKIIGVVDNSDGAHFGLYINQAAYSSVARTPATPEAQAYYFKVAPGQDKRALALKLGSAFLDKGLETTVLEDAIWQKRGPRILISDVLLGMVGMVLLLGVAALALTGTRAVVERRQQIGMLRALGGGRRLIEGAFLLEAFMLGCVGSILGIVLGVILARNIFAVDFFEQFNTGLTFAIPWGRLGLIVTFSLLASLLAALLPAWQAGRVAPTEALRY